MTASCYVLNTLRYILLLSAESGQQLRHQTVELHMNSTPMHTELPQPPNNSCKHHGLLPPNRKWPTTARQNWQSSTCRCFLHKACPHANANRCILCCSQVANYCATKLAELNVPCAPMHTHAPQLMQLSRFYCCQSAGGLLLCRTARGAQRAAASCTSPAPHMPLNCRTTAVNLKMFFLLPNCRWPTTVPPSSRSSTCRWPRTKWG